MKKLTFRQELYLLRSGRRSFSRFALSTTKRWEALAAYLLRRWQAPAAVEPRDLVQELLLGAWRYVREWDPARLDKGGQPVPIARYVVWNATNDAKRWLHKQRGAGRARGMSCADWAPSRHAITASEMRGRRGAATGEVETVEARLDRAANRFAVGAGLLGGEDEQAARVDCARARERVAALVAPHQAAALEHLLREMDVDAAAESVYADPEARLAARLGSPAQARRYMRQLLRGMARQSGAA